MDRPQVHITIENESVDAIRRVRVLTAEDCEELLAVTFIGPNLVQLNENPLLAEAQFGDIVEVEYLPNGVLRLIRIAEASGLERLGWVVSVDIVTSPVLTEFLNRILAMGGYFEACIGMLILNVPKAQKTSAEAEFSSIVDRIQSSQKSHD
jgi:hypothetical protein